MLLILSVSPKGTRLAEGLRKMYNEKVMVIGDEISIKDIYNLKPNFIISHGYNKKIKSDVIEVMHGKVINSHPSMLPLNRGNYPLFFSIVYGCITGVTIHRVASGLDTGDILLQKEIKFDYEHETFQSTYDQAETLMYDLIMDNYLNLKHDKINSVVQKGESTFHTTKEFVSFREKIQFDWNDNVAMFLRNNKEEIEKFKYQWNK